MTENSSSWSVWDQSRELNNSDAEELRLPEEELFSNSHLGKRTKWLCSLQVKIEYLTVTMNEILNGNSQGCVM